jgi:hypothetical protein
MVPFTVVGPSGRIVWGSSAAGSPAPVSRRQVAGVNATAGEPPATAAGRCHSSRALGCTLAIGRGITDASATTIRRWLHDDAIKPRQRRLWICMRDPAFPAKAGPDEDVICANR